jgi:hypothetical protein
MTNLIFILIFKDPKLCWVTTRTFHILFELILKIIKKKIIDNIITNIIVIVYIIIINIITIKINIIN